ncbi:MAG: hypothetical protein ACYTFG_13565, partial [Planctomycetota bacterium]
MAAIVHGVVCLILGAMMFVEERKSAPEEVVISLKYMVERKKHELPAEPEKVESVCPDPKSEAMERSRETEQGNGEEPSHLVATRRIQLDDPVAPPQAKPDGHGNGKHRGQGASGGEWEAVRLGLKWLAGHQDGDGKWDWTGFTRHCREGICDCPSGVHSGVSETQGNFSVGLTGLGLLCF